MQLQDYLKDSILLLDGAMGTYYNDRYPGEGEAEESNRTNPERIIGIHMEYIEAGAQLIRTNTFAVNHLLFPDSEQLRPTVQAAVVNARTAIARSGRDVFLAASIGPLRQDAMSPDKELLDEYRTLIQAFLDEGVDIFFLETFAEVKWLRLVAGLIKEQCSNAYVVAQCSVNPAGFTKFGYRMQQIVLTLSETEAIDAFGFNCGVGAAHLSRLLGNIVYPKDCVLSVLPNAGYQHELRGRRRYQDQPVYYARQMEQLVRQGANLVGGCCGTTPAHIKALARMLGQLAGEGTQTDGLHPFAKRIQMPVNQSDAVVEPNPFLDKLLKGEEKVFVVELDSPFDADADKFEQGARLLQDNRVDMVTVSDSPMARARADANMMALLVQEHTGLNVMPHIACRDRNLIALRSLLLGAHINGIRNLLVITGDPVARDDRDMITSVFDVNSIRLMEYIKNMNDEVFRSAPMVYGGALNYAGVNVDAVMRRMELKIEQGCSYFLTQPIYSDADVERIKLLKSKVDTKILCGLMPLVSYKNALFMHNEMPGIHVPDEVLAQYRPELTRDEAQAVAVKVTVEIARKLYDVADGFYIMTPFQRVGLVNQIIDEIRKL